MVLLQGSKLESKNTEEAGITNKIILLVQAILTYPTYFKGGLHITYDLFYHVFALYKSG